ncbi:MAG TPA: helix-turn-helix transcriptional regulator [Candidatus Saccharimonadia bacterium]|nr:helix-turn-helix transcriptional regulator [Candidatus Saccharimonadia bacterium]
MQLPSSFPERLHHARRRLRWEQGELGKKIGLTGHTIGRLERGQTTQIGIETLRQLARTLGVSTDWLLAMDVKDESPTEEKVDELIAASHA